LENGLSIKDVSRNMGFDNHDLNLDNQPEVITGKATRFYNLAMDVVDEYFRDQEKN